MEASLKDLKRELWLRLRERGMIVHTISTNEQIPIKDMTIEHLVNTIKLIERQQSFRSILEDIGEMDANDLL